MNAQANSLPNHPMKSTILVSLLAVACTTAYGQDPVTTSPKYYKVLLENDQVRVLEYRLKPGEREPMHSHPAGVVYLLSGARVKFTYPDGKTEEKPAASGETIWREPTTHAVENVGAIETHAIAIDLKSAKPAQTSKDEETLWNLERAYRRYVQDNNLSSYSNLWHERFLGWPSVSTTPVHKDHITDWITAQTSKGLIFKTDELKPASIQVTGDAAMVCYWITFKWVDKAGNGPAYTLRITHAWLKTGNDWRIIGGMSMPEPDKPST
jgi:quercetin dioxygenase-like cupin family protein/ketosteroid isomerase-like protein